jgi:hypothetical protein
MDLAAAQQAFDSLVAEHSDTCLWFIREHPQLSVEAPAAHVLLSAIVRHGTRDAWQKAKALQSWRSLHIK